MNFGNDFSGSIVVEDIRVSVGATAIVDRASSEMTYLKLGSIVMEYESIIVKVDGDGPIAYIANKITEVGDSLREVLVALLANMLNSDFKDQVELSLAAHLPHKVGNLRL